MAKFKPGQSGNPAGRTKGLPDKRNHLRSLLEPHRGALIEKAVSLALSGDTAALKLCIDRLIPALRPQDAPLAVPFDAGGNKGASALAIFKQITEGEVSPSVGRELLAALVSVSEITEVEALTDRVAALERR
jgi:Family of unknown function (DUF5681)